MLSTPTFFRETHLIGPRCREHALDEANHPVLRNAPFRWIGHSTLYAPYRMVRLRSVHSHVLASISGRGRALIGGKAVDWKPGQVMLGPVGVHHAFEIADDGPWRIAWVFFHDRVTAPVLPGREPMLIDADATDFVATAQMLTREAAGAARGTAMEALVTLLNVHARELADSREIDRRLWRIWEEVELDLARAWDVNTLARLAHTSPEHLRRLCHRHHQRSPMAHVTLLRLRRAGALLRASPLSIDDISRQVGYASVYAFSTAFRRWSGLPPGRFRQKG